MHRVHEEASPAARKKTAGWERGGGHSSDKIREIRYEDDRRAVAVGQGTIIHISLVSQRIICITKFRKISYYILRCKQIRFSQDYYL